MAKEINGKIVETAEDIRDDVHGIAQTLGWNLSDFKSNFDDLTTEVWALHDDAKEVKHVPFSKDTEKTLHKLDHDLARRDEHIDPERAKDDMAMPPAMGVSPSLVAGLHQDSMDDEALYTDAYFKVLRQDAKNFVYAYLYNDAKRRGDKADEETKDFVMNYVA